MSTSNQAAPVMRFVGLCGAIVAVTPAAQSNYYRWACQGCGASEDPQVEVRARDEANDHAAHCRALPRT